MKAEPFGNRGSSAQSRTRIPSLNAIKGESSDVSAFADYGVIRIALGAEEKDVLDLPLEHAGILDSGFQGFALPLVSECLIPQDAFREKLNPPVKIRAVSGDVVIIKETATVFLKVAMSPGEASLWSGSDRQGEKVAIQGDTGDANPATIAYFLPCWFVPRGLDPKLCRAQLL